MGTDTRVKVGLVTNDEPLVQPVVHIRLHLNYTFHHIAQHGSR